MTIKDKMKQYNFWISLVSACLLVARIIAGKFNYVIDSSLVMDVTTGLCSIFVIMGIISAPTKVVTKIVADVTNDETSKEELTKMITSSDKEVEEKAETDSEEIENVISEKLQNYLLNTKNPSDFSSNSEIFAENESASSESQPETCDENNCQDFVENDVEVGAQDNVNQDGFSVNETASNLKTINGVIYDLNQLSKEELFNILTNN